MMTRIVIVAAISAAVAAGCGGNGGTDPGGETPAVPDEDVPFSTSDWKTNFSRHTVPLDEFIGGGPPKDGIPSIDDPEFVSAEQADEFLAPREPVATVETRGQVHAYPLQILTWHEIVREHLEDLKRRAELRAERGRSR